MYFKSRSVISSRNKHRVTWADVKMATSLWMIQLIFVAVMTMVAQMLPSSRILDIVSETIQLSNTNCLHTFVVHGDGDKTSQNLCVALKNNAEKTLKSKDFERQVLNKRFSFKPLYKYIVFSKKDWVENLDTLSYIIENTIHGDAGRYYASYHQKHVAEAVGIQKSLILLYVPYTYIILALAFSFSVFLPKES